MREANAETLASYEILVKVTELSNGWIQADRRDLIKEYAALHESEKAARYKTELAEYSR